MTSTFLPILVGLVLGAVGSAAFILRAKTFSDENESSPKERDRQREVALRSVVVAYTVIALICLIVSLVVGDAAFIVVCGVLVLIAVMGLVRVWSER